MIRCRGGIVIFAGVRDICNRKILRRFRRSCVVGISNKLLLLMTLKLKL